MQRLKNCQRQRPQVVVYEMRNRTESLFHFLPLVRGLAPHSIDCKISHTLAVRSEERRVGKECRSAGSAHHDRKKNTKQPPSDLEVHEWTVYIIAATQ